MRVLRYEYGNKKIELSEEETKIGIYYRITWSHHSMAFMDFKQAHDYFRGLIESECEPVETGPFEVC